MKCCFDLKLLQELCLFPPSGCSLQKWQCFAGPCPSNGGIKHINLEVIKAIRLIVNKEDQIHDDFYDQYKLNWSEQKVSRNPKSTVNISSYGPVILFPIRALNIKVSNYLNTHCVRISDVVSELFVCPKHFRFEGPYKNFVTSSLFSYSLETINELLERDQIKFSLPNYVVRNLPFIQPLRGIIKKEQSFLFTFAQPLDVQLSDGLRNQQLGYFQRMENADNEIALYVNTFAVEIQQSSFLDGFDQ